MYNVYRTPVDDEGKFPVFEELVETYQEAEKVSDELIKAYAEYDFTEDDIFITYAD